jgi:hypothetical protein
MLLRCAVDARMGKRDPASMEQRMVQIGYDGAVWFARVKRRCGVLVWGGPNSDVMVGSVSGVQQGHVDRRNFRFTVCDSGWLSWVRHHPLTDCGCAGLTKMSQRAECHHDQDASAASG